MRKRFIFYGRVQGVGFRYKAYYAAGRYGITGFARNLDNGTVEMEAEGSEEAIDRLIRDLENDRYIVIDKIDARAVPEKGDRCFVTD